MTDLLDEIGENSGRKIGATVHNLGGDLLDEIGIKGRDTSNLSPALSEAAINEDRKLLLADLNNDLSTFDKFRVGMGRGLATIGRAVGLVEPEAPVVTEAFGQLADESLVAAGGEIVGEALPFLPAGVAAAGVKAIGARILASIGVGAAEGGAIVKGKGGDVTETTLGAGLGGAIAGTAEAIIPVIGRLGGRIFRKLRRQPKGPLLTEEGVPTPEFQAALDETGTSFDDLSREAFAEVNKQGVDPAQAARAARFESQGIPATAGDITQDFAQQAEEQRLISMAGAEAGEPLRQAKLEQSQIFTGKVNELVDSLGVPGETGDSLKTALTGRKKVLQAEKNRLYKEVADASPELSNVPLLTGDILAAVPTGPKLRRLSRLAGSQVEAVQDLLVEFGIERGDDAVEAFAKSGGEVTPLNLGNFEDFRAALNQIERADTTGAAKVATGPIKKALDAEAELIDQHVKASGLGDESILATLKEARERVRTIKTEFSPQAITGRLIDVKRDGVTPVIEASKVANELLKPTAPIENLQRTLRSLRKAGPDGNKAISDLQSSVVLNALNDAFKAPSRKTGGLETIGGNQFAKSLNKFGDDKLKELFKGNENALNRLQNLKQTALDIEPTAGATPKGSAPVILDIMRRAGRLPGMAAIVDVVNLVAKAGADDRAVRKAINSKPAFKVAVSALERDFPALAGALGVAGVVPIVQDEQ